MAPFKVLIAGGSVAGMALANILEIYGIDYELIEKHSTIAPQLGASLAIIPHAARILDQLGCWDIIESLSTPVDTMTVTGPDGRQLAYHGKFGMIMNELYVITHFGRPVKTNRTHGQGGVQDAFLRSPADHPVSLRQP